MISAGAVSRVLASLPPDVTPIYSSPGSGSASTTSSSTTSYTGTSASDDSLTSSSSSWVLSTSFSSWSQSSAALSAGGMQESQDPVAYNFNGTVYSKYEFMVQISASLTLLLGIMQLFMGMYCIRTIIIIKRWSSRRDPNKTRMLCRTILLLCYLYSYIHKHLINGILANKLSVLRRV